MYSLVLDSVVIVVYLSGVPMVGIAVATGCVALVQAATQIQEQSVLHLVRVVTFIVFVLCAGEWGGGVMCDLFERSLRSIETIGGR